MALKAETGSFFLAIEKKIGGRVMMINEEVHVFIQSERNRAI